MSWSLWARLPTLTWRPAPSSSTCSVAIGWVNRRTVNPR
ncbi:hypothetical protein chiPu_0026988, partial [Chiloscyllium punctatum]|nr:hypothetical protein [Chiloscyllium punctatum]